MPLFLSREQLSIILKQAESEYPKECCGLGLADKTKPDHIVQILPCCNLQDQFHAHDPVQYPRTSKGAYLVDPSTLLEVQKKVRQEGLLIRLIYHSHIESPCWFSEEDTRQAIHEGEPIYADASHLVISVVRQTHTAYTLYHWNEQSNLFYPASLTLF